MTKKRNKRPAAKPATAKPVAHRSLNLTHQLGFRAIYDPSDSGLSTLFPIEDDFLKGLNDGNKVRRFIFIDPDLKMEEADRNKFIAAAARCVDGIARDTIKPLKGTGLTDPGTGKKEACWELKIGGSANRLLGGWVTIDGEEEGEQYSILVLNTLVGKVGDKTKKPAAFKRPLLFPTAFKRPLLFPRFRLPTKAPKPKEPARLFEASSASAAAATPAFLEAPPSVSPITTRAELEALLSEITETKARITQRYQKQAQQQEAFSRQYASQVDELAAHPAAIGAIQAKKMEQALVKEVLDFVAHLQKQHLDPAVLDATKAERYAAIVIGLIARKGTSAYQSLKKTDGKKYGIPPEVAEHIEQYIYENPLLWQLRNHIGLANELKYFLENGESLDFIAQHYLPQAEPEKVDFAADEKEPLSAEEVLAHFNALEETLQNKERPPSTQDIAEIRALLDAVHVEIPVVPEGAHPEEVKEAEESAEESEESEEEDSDIGQGSDDRLEMPSEERSLVCHPLIAALQKHAAQVDALSAKCEAQAEQRAKYDLVTQQTQEAQIELERRISLFFQVMRRFLDTQEETHWARNAAAGLVGQVIQAMIEGPAAYARMLQEKCTPVVANWVKKYVKAHPSLWDLHAYQHRDFAHAQVEALYRGRRATLKAASPAEAYAADSPEEKQEVSRRPAVFGVSPHFKPSEEELTHMWQSLHRYHAAVIATEKDGMTGKQWVENYLDKHQGDYQAVIRLQAGQAGKEPALESIGIQCMQAAKRYIKKRAQTFTTPQEAVPALYKHLQGQGKPTLIVFEDAASSAAIQPYLPPASTNPYDEAKVHTLITSADPNNWGECIAPIAAPRPSREKAFDFFSDSLPNASQDEAYQLGSGLSYSPLALAYAVACINAEESDLATYLKSAEWKEANGQEGIDPTLVAFRRSLARIQASHPAALSILSRCVYLAARDIPLAWLEAECAPYTPEQMREAHLALQRYAILQPSSKPNCLDINPHLQSLLRANILKEPDMQRAQEEVMQCAVEATSQADLNPLLLHPLLPHLDALVAHCDHAVLKEKEVPGFVSMLMSVGDYYLTQLKQPKKACALFTPALYILKSKPAEQREQTLSCLTSIGIAYCRASDFKGAEEVLFFVHNSLSEKNRDIQQHKETCRILMGLADVYGALNKFQEKRAILENLLLKIEINKGKVKNAQQIYFTYIEIAKTYRILAAENKTYENTQTPKDCLDGAFNFFKQAIKLQEKMSGRSSLELIPALIELSELYALFARLQVDKKKVAEAIPVLERLLAIQESHPGKDHSATVATLVRFAEIYDYLGEIQKKKVALERAVAIQEKHYFPDHYEVAAILVHLGNTHGEMEDFKEQQKRLARALAIQEAHLGDQRHYEIAATLVGLGNAYSGLEEHRKGLRLLEQALHIQEAHFGTKIHHEVAPTLVGLSNIYRHLGEHEKSREYALLALSIQEEYYTPSHPKLVNALISRGYAHEGLGEYKLASKTLGRGYKIQLAYYGEEHYKTADMLTHLFTLKRVDWSFLSSNPDDPDLRTLKVAIKMLENVVNIQKKHYGEESKQFGAALFVLGKMYRFLANAIRDDIAPGPQVRKKALALEEVKKLLDKSKEKIEKGLGIQEALYGTDHYKLAATLISLASTYCIMGNHQAAREASQRALAIQDIHFGQNHPESALALTFLANAFYFLGQHQKAQTIKKRVLRILMGHPLYGEQHPLTQSCAEILKRIPEPEKTAENKRSSERGSVVGAPQSFFHHPPTTKPETEPQETAKKKKKKKKSKSKKNSSQPGRQ